MGAAPGGYRRTDPGAVLVRAKAVCILLTLHLGSQNTCLSPRLPAFPSPNVAEYPIDLHPTTTPEQALKAILN